MSLRRTPWLPLLLCTTVLGACTTRETLKPAEKQARVRNAPPSYCTDANFGQCPPMERETCGDGTEPVIDYDNSCCPHFTCQPGCPSGAVAVGCNGWPAPTCPNGTDLLIGSDDQCCAVYRCRPSNSNGGDCRASSQLSMCPEAFPNCNGAMPVEVGVDDNCCPIWQCACGIGGEPPTPSPQPLPPGYDGGAAPNGTTTTDTGGSSTSNIPGSMGSGTAPNGGPDKCGCTYPTCAFGQVLVCSGANVCGFPCECVDPGRPPEGDCTSDDQCMAGSRCLHDMNECLPGPGCSCPPDSPGPCPACPAVCFGKCVNDGVVNGCGGNVDCGPNYACEIACTSCDPTRNADCKCDPNLPPGVNGQRCEICVGSCVAQPTCGRSGSGSGTSTGGTTTGGMSGGGAPTPTGGTNGGGSTDPGTGVACAMPSCPDGGRPFEVGYDPMTCCPIWQCVNVCTPTGVPCQVPQCDNPIITGTDMNCCPVACCPGANGDTCPVPPPQEPLPCRSDMDCLMGDICIQPDGCLGGPIGCVGKCTPRGI